MIHFKLYKNLKFYYINKWYVHKPESTLKNETETILFDFQIVRVDLIAARIPHLVISKKKKKKEKEKAELLYCELFLPDGPQCGNQRKLKKRHVHGYHRRTKKNESNGDTNCNWRSWNSSQRFGKGAGSGENPMANRNYSNNNIF